MYRPDPVPRPLIEELLDLAVWAPNHRMAEPWRFYVFTGDARGAVAAIHRDLVREEAAGSEERAQRRYAELLGIPVFLFVSYVRDAESKKDRENYAAVACAIQNLMLAAHARGLGTVWRTGNVIRDRRTRSLLGLEEQEELVGLLHLGYPAHRPEPRPRTPALHKTIFRGG